MKWVGDAGHGGKDSGAVNKTTGLLEKDVALVVTKRVVSLIAPHVEASLTRSEDIFLSLTKRADIANQRAADLFSVHLNAGGGTGIEVFTSHGQTASDPVATAVLEEMGSEFPNRVIRADFSDGDPDKEARFAVLTRTKGRAILIELGFIDTLAGSKFLADTDNQERLAYAIARGLLKADGLSLNASPKSPAGVVDSEEENERLKNIDWITSQILKENKDLPSGRLEKLTSDLNAIRWQALQLTQ